MSNRTPESDRGSLDPSPDAGRDDASPGTSPDTAPHPSETSEPLPAEREGGTGAGLESPLDPEAQVADYLRAHPDFLARHPEVLAELRVPHETGGAISLIEHQVDILRRQLKTERGRLTHLISRARDYEVVSNRLHALVLRLIPARSLKRLRETLAEALCQELAADAVSLKLFPLDLGPGDPSGAQPDQDPLTASFRDFLEREHALCGPLGTDKQDILFDAAKGEIRSAALVPIRAEGRSGVLAIGAADPHRFRADMGTELLDRLGEIVAHKLRALPAERSAAARPKTARRTEARPATKSAAKPATKPATKSATKAKSGPRNPKSRKSAGSFTVVELAPSDES